MVTIEISDFSELFIVIPNNFRTLLGITTARLSAAAHAALEPE
jgi:hypothetical protein